MSYQSPTDWFDAPGGLRFQCTCCGNCCTGPEGYILFTDAEGDRLAARLGISPDEFLRDYTKQTTLGVSLKETETPRGLDCVFLDRNTIPGKALCGVYEDRPAQCRTWPFWKSIVRTEQTWRHASHTCPGINRGPLIPPTQIRILRDTVDL
jgi:Fe-S-cluster containining protein